MDETAVDGGNTDDSDDGENEDISILVISFPSCMWSQNFLSIRKKDKKCGESDSQG